MIINLNRLVTVTLTETGRDHYREHVLLLDTLGGVGGTAKDRVVRNETPGEDGKVTMPLWQIFDVFGDALDGTGAPIVGGNIDIGEP